ncbi:MAG TPA: class I SAM-dependent methyltransferase [Anaerolineae bacterium]|nr:class I SAM-dependent methyltransferase [Anaerolineae bacterium]HQK15389.1 class I SAM-dependent methyltransferase [Anaerolineae bacterium]
MGADDRLEYYRHRYATLRPGWEHATARYQRWIAARLTSDSRVLDLGCGRGGVVERLGVTGHWCGCDPDWCSLKEHRRAQLARVQAGSERLPFADGVFDIVIASWVLEHLLCPPHTFSEVVRVLRPGGRFFFLTPNLRHPIPRLSRRLARLRALQPQLVAAVYRRAEADTFPVYYRANTFETLEQLAAHAGLHLVQMEWVDDPSYFAWTEGVFRLAVCLETLLPFTWRVHLVGEYIKRSNDF